jgi:hypothetical protein
MNPGEKEFLGCCPHFICNSRLETQIDQATPGQIGELRPNLVKASARRMYFVRRDSMIVARHEVPGVMRKIASSQRDD